MTKKAAQESNKKTAEPAKFEPIKMGLAVAAAAATSLVLLAVVAMYS